jgi:hypothetical protein
MKYKCPRCLGKGHINAFRHIAGGRCFQCGGAGSLQRTQARPARSPFSLEIVEGGEGQGGEEQWVWRDANGHISAMQDLLRGRSKQDLLGIASNNLDMVRGGYARDGYFTHIWRVIGFATACAATRSPKVIARGRAAIASDFPQSSVRAFDKAIRALRQG